MKANLRVFRTMLMTLVFLVFVIVFFEQASVTAKAEELTPAGRWNVEYQCVKIRRGDTLEQYADRYNRSEVGSTEEYMNSVRQINGMTEDRLHPGCFLTVLRYR